MTNWKLNSWRNKPIKHQPVYADKGKIDNVLKELSTFPPLVFAGESRSLKKKLGEVSQGKAFLLQGGDCAESFLEFHPNNIRDFFKVVLQMSLILTVSSKLPVIKVGRVAGQFSKPRSAPTEKQGDKELPSYLGDNINAIDFNEKARRPDPKRLFKAYSQSASTLNLLRAFSKGGFAEHPAWYNNLVVQPKVQVQVAADKFSATAVAIYGARRQELWNMMAEVWPLYIEYQQKTDRHIPVVALVRD